MQMNMGIDSIAGMMDQTYRSASNGRTEALQKRAGADLSEADDKELMEVCKEFEAYFVEQ